MLMFSHKSGNRVRKFGCYRMDTKPNWAVMSGVTNNNSSTLTFIHWNEIIFDLAHLFTYTNKKPNKSNNRSNTNIPKQQQ